MTTADQESIAYCASPALLRAQGQLVARRRGEGWRQLATAHHGIAPVISKVASDLTQSPLEKQTVTIFPSLMLTILQEEKSAVSRIWLLLRHLDTEGQGWISIADARSQLTKKESSLRVCGWRQLRYLLAEGNGVFWERDKTHIWLRSVTKVAFALNVERMQGMPVELPVTALTEGIGSVRAHFYASFHSGRGEKASEKPISRETLTQLSGVSRQTMRSYERRTKTNQKKNIGVGKLVKHSDMQAVAAERGHGVFTLTDGKGLMGKVGEQYVAWQLPNSYVGPHERRHRSCQKRINQTLRDLSLKGMTGNSSGLVGAGSDESYGRVFFKDGKSAVKSSKKSADSYWLNKKGANNQVWLTVSTS